MFEIGQRIRLKKTELRTANEVFVPIICSGVIKNLLPTMNSALVKWDVGLDCNGEAIDEWWIDCDSLEAADDE